MQGINPILAKQEAKSKQITVKDFAELYIKERVPVTRKQGKSSKKFIDNMRRYIINAIGKYYLSDITDLQIRKLIASKVSSGHHSTALSTLSILKLLFDYAIERNLITSNPVKNSKFYNIAPRRHRSRWLSEDEITRCFQILYSSNTIRLEYAIAIHLLLMLLLRKTELIHAKWSQVNFEKQTFTLMANKTDTPLLIILPTQAIKLLKLLSQDSEYIFAGFTNNNKPINDSALNKQIEIINHMMFGNDNSQYFTVHDLRRTGATHLGDENLEYPSDYIEMALNHTKEGMKKVYQRGGYLRQRKDMLQHWANVIDGLIGEEELLPYDRLLK